MIIEDYVSYEVAQLLKSKGFDIPCDYAYNNKAGYFEVNRSNFDEIYCFRPSLAMVMKWLREVHNLSVEVYRTACGYVGCIVAIPSGTDIKFLEDDGDDLPSGQYTTWERACEASIEYCIENLI